MHLNFLAVVTLATGAFADIYTRNSLNQIRDAAADYNKALASWDGSYLGAVPLLTRSTTLINTLKAASAGPNAATWDDTPPEERDRIEEEVFRIAQDLANEVGSAVDTAISAVPKFNALLLVGMPMALQTFESMQNAASNLGNVYSTKASDDRRGDAHEIKKQIDDHFQRGIAAFQ